MHDESSVTLSAECDSISIRALNEAGGLHAGNVARSGACSWDASE